MPPLPPALRRALLVLAGGCALWAAAILLTGGAVIEIGGVRLSSRSASRPMIAALACLAVVAAAAEANARRRGMARTVGAIDAVAPTAAVVLAVVVAGTSAVFNEHVAGGADSSGYVSQSRLWAQGRLTVTAPVYTDDPWPQRGWLVSPLGYAPAATAGELGPSYAPGLPWLMALGAAIAGEPGRYVWTPLAAGLVIWLSFVAGRRLDSPAAGLAAGLLVAGSAPVLFNAMQTMSDLVCTALWTGAILAATAARPRAGLAGVLGALALAVRPNLVLASALVWGVWLLTAPAPWRTRLRQAVTIAAPLAVVAVVVAWIGHRLWGSPLASGYGATADLFQAANVPGNLARVWRWTRETAGWWTVAGVPALAWAAVRLRGAPALGLALAAGLALSYLPYALFDEWWYLRFYLPAWPLLAAATAAAATRLGRRVLPVLTPLAVIALAALSAWTGWGIADQAGVFSLWAGAQRYRAVAAFVRADAPPDALVLGVQHSGALADGGGRTVGRWDYIAPEALDTTVERLAAAGRTVWLVADSFEEAPFRARFAGTRRGALDWAPLAELRGVGERVRIYDLTSPTRFTAPRLVPAATGGPWPWRRRVGAAASKIAGVSRWRASLVPCWPRSPSARPAGRRGPNSTK
ncbi:MAG: hypothetical protein U0802_21360 [Candidatus Binatia bacterium]